MAALTWRDVQAPSLAGAGDMINSANASFGNAMEMLRANAERSAAQRRAQYSAGMIQKLVGLSDADQVGQFAQQWDAGELTPEALTVLMNQPGVLLDREHKGVQIDTAKDTLDFTQKDRLGQQEAAKLMAEAQMLAASGDLAGANAKIAQAQNPYAMPHIVDDISKLGTAASNFQERRGTEYSHGRTVNENAAKDAARDYIHGTLLPQASSVDEARLMVQRAGFDPMVADAIWDDLSGMTDDQFRVIDSNLPTLFDADPTLKTDYNVLSLESDFVKADSANLANATPLAKMATHLKAMQAAQGDPDKGPQNIADYVKSVGVNAGGISGAVGWEGINENISEVEKALKDEGITVKDRAEIAAALIATADTSNIAFSDSLSMRPESAIELLRTAQKPGEMRKAMVELAEYQAPSQKIDELDAKIAAEVEKYSVYVSKGQQDKADKARATVQELMAEQRDVVESWKEKRTPREAEPKTEAVNTALQMGVPSGANMASINNILGAAAGSQVRSMPPNQTFAGGTIVPPTPDQVAAQMAAVPLSPRDQWLARQAAALEERRENQRMFTGFNF